MQYQGSVFRIPNSPEGIALAHRGLDSGGFVGIRGILKKLTLCGFICGAVISIQRSVAEDARVLPKGIFRFTYARSQTSGISDEYNASGDSQSLTAPYQLSLDAGTLAKFKPKIKSLVEYMRLNWVDLRFNSSGVSDDPNDPFVKDHLSRGNLEVQAEGTRTQSTLALQRGLTDRLSVALIVPRVSTSVRASASIQGRNTAQMLHGYFATDESGTIAEVVDGLGELSNLQVETFQQLLQQQGYHRFESTEQSGWGDTNLGARYNFHKSDRWLHSFQGSISAPTGELKDPASLTQVDQGVGAWQASFAQISNFNATRDLMLSGALHYTRSFQDTRSKRTYSTDESHIDSYLPGANRQEEVSFTLGDKAWVTAGADYALNPQFSVGTQYEIVWKGKDAYNGGFADGDYERMSRDSDMRLTAIQLSAGFSSIELFQKKRFPLPLDARVTYYRPLTGRNTPIAPYVTGEISMYF